MCWRGKYRLQTEAEQGLFAMRNTCLWINPDSHMIFFVGLVT